MLRPQNEGASISYYVGGVAKKDSDTAEPDICTDLYMRAILVDLNRVSSHGWKSPCMKEVIIPGPPSKLALDFEYNVHLRNGFSAPFQTKVVMTTSCTAPAAPPADLASLEVTEHAYNEEIAAMLLDEAMVAVRAGNKDVATIGVGHCRGPCLLCRGHEALVLLVYAPPLGVVGGNDESHHIRRWRTHGGMASKEMNIGNFTLGLTFRRTTLGALEGRPKFHLGVEVSIAAPKDGSASIAGESNGFVLSPIDLTC